MLRNIQGLSEEVWWGGGGGWKASRKSYADCQKISDHWLQKYYCRQTYPVGVRGEVFYNPDTNWWRTTYRYLTIVYNEENTDA